MSDIDPAVASMIRNLEEKTGRAFPDSLEDVDEALLAWLRAAYDAA